MNSLVKFVKELTLSKEEKLMRKHGIKNEDGEYTLEAKEVVINKICKENETDLVTIAQGLEAEEKEAKKTN